MTETPTVAAPPYAVVKTGQARKLNPFNESHVLYEVGYDPKAKTYALRIAGNEAGGQHSRDWLPVAELARCLAALKAQQPFPTTVLRPLYGRGSSNNAGFLAAILRAEGLLIADETKPFLHRLGESLERWQKSLTVAGASKG